MADLTIIILTFNEAQHLERTVRSVRSACSNILVVDSFSTDRTPDIASDLGCHVLQNPWVNYATQFNWAIGHCPFDTGWLMRLDADEWMNQDLSQAIQTQLDSVPDHITGLRIARRMVFMGRWIRWGGVGERMMLRLWRRGRAKAEQRWMDEHMVVDGGEVAMLPGAIIDENLNSLTWWTAKHNSYASREAVDQLLQELRRQAAGEENPGTSLEGQARRIRFLKKQVYGRIPPVIRGSLLFLYRYFAALGFLDGMPGLYFHFLQSFWYRTLVDAKLYEVRKTMKHQNLSLKAAIHDRLGINVGS